MARIRTIKPEFFTSEDIVELSAFARLLYIAIWCEADREGRLEWKPKTFKLRYFPADNIDIDALCEEITSRGLVTLYGERLGYIPAFLVHQHINPRESASTLPAPSDALSRVKHASSRDSDAQGGRERKGKEGDMSGNPDVLEILAYLNQKAKRDYRAVDSNLRLIAARLGEGATVSECKRVIDAKVLAWAKDEKMQTYLRPETLFNATKFAQYVGELGAPKLTEVGEESWRSDPRFKGAK